MQPLGWDRKLNIISSQPVTRITKPGSMPIGDAGVATKNLWPTGE